MLAVFARHGIVPELGLMDLGFVSNAVVLRDDGVLLARPWFLVELDSPSYGSGTQVAPSTVANYEALAAPLRDHFPSASWAAHGHGTAGYSVLSRALANGAHVRVGFEDAVRLPGGAPPRSNADLVTWAVAAGRAVGREPASAVRARTVVGLPAASSWGHRGDVNLRRRPRRRSRDPPDPTGRRRGPIGPPASSRS